MRTLLSFLLVIVLFSSCSKMDKEVNISELNQQFISAWNNKDADKVISFLSDDVLFLQANTQYKGKAEVSDKWVRETMPTIRNLKTYSLNTGSDSKIAYEGGTFSVDVLPTAPNEPMATGEGNYILLWKKGEDGNWKLNYAQLEDLPLRIKTQ
ncbi:YybH family protein [Adhaeribacter aquaticus]|uniref:YybH family protein n=1 Tax=Adhaeribacter aquaticus TaxID=299567 RepID=UPI000420617A|nr:DUF4440 domain-containing protein [Adhaeribacter aquaticus]